MPLPAPFGEYFIAPGASLLSAVKRMDALATKLLMVGSAEAFGGMLSIGDIQRHIVRTGGIDGAVAEAQRTRTTVGRPSDDPDTLRAHLRDTGIAYLPIVEAGRVVDVLLPAVRQSEDPPPELAPLRSLHVPCVIMAGGLGTRMAPLTSILPKPLVPLGDRPIVEHIIHRFREAGVDEFYITVNYRKSWLRLWREEYPYAEQITLVEEPTFLGTGGSLKFVNTDAPRLFVANCDILADVDYADLHRFHLAHGHLITAVAFLAVESSPYGTMELSSAGQLERIREKPEQANFVNAGIYLIEREAIDLLPEGQLAHMTHLMEMGLAAGRSVGVYPINAHSWHDLGDWEKYLAAQARWAKGLPIGASR